MQFQWPFTNTCGFSTSTMAHYKKAIPNIARLASSKSSNYSYSEEERYLTQVHAFVLRTTTFPDPPPHFLFHSQALSSSDRIAYFCYILKHLENLNLSLDLCNAVLRKVSSSGNGMDSIQAMVFVREMAYSGYFPDKYTVPSALKACAHSRAIREGLQLQAYSVKTGLLASNVYVRNTTMRLYAVSGLVDSVRQLFDESPERDLITWTTLIQCYVKQGRARESVEAFFQMLEAKIEPDEKTLVVVLSACAKLGDLELGKRIHEHAIRVDPSTDVFVGNALVDMYLKCGDAESARATFDSITERNVVSWNSLISGLAHQGRSEAALSAFQVMQSEDGLEPDSVTLVSALNSCANLGLLETGSWVHAYAEKHQIEADGFLGNALIDMYAKCGSVDRAVSVFESMRRRDVYSYSALITALALHGEARRALSVFSEMGQAQVRPDEVTFVGLLAACSHAGLVSEGKRLFEEMSSLYGIRPRAEHFGCMVDLLGRAGQVEEAVEVIRAMPMEPDADVWGALLGACKIHGRVELGEEAMDRLLMVEPERDGAYVLMSNIYSSANKWRQAVRVRKEMKQNKVKKTPGGSSIQVNGVVYEFRKGERLDFPRSKEAYDMLHKITMNLKNDEQNLSDQVS